MSETTDQSLHKDLARLNRAKTSRPARLIAAVLTPANVVLGLLAYVSLKYSSSWLTATGWWLITLVLVVGVPYAILFRAIRAGKVADRQVVRREQRPWLFAAAITCVIVALGVLALTGAPRQIVALIVAMLSGLVAMGAVTLVWKASMHLAVASGAVTVLAIENPTAGLIAAVVLPVLAWSRWRDGRHSLAQLIGGGIIGAAAAAAVYSLTR